LFGAKNPDKIRYFHVYRLFFSKHLQIDEFHLESLYNSQHLHQKNGKFFFPSHLREHKKRPAEK